MSANLDKTWDLFMAAKDDDLGYPDDVAFVPDEEWADEVLWRNLAEGRATVLVGEEIELLLTPLRRSLIDRLRGRARSTSPTVSTGTPRRTRPRAGSGATRCGRCASSRTHGPSAALPLGATAAGAGTLHADGYPYVVCGKFLRRGRQLPESPPSPRRPLCPGGSAFAAAGARRLLDVTLHIEEVHRCRPPTI